jgi:serine/threonine-protein kinase
MDSDPDAELAGSELIGQLIADRYRVEQLLGEGGMGAVYRATHVQLHKPVAIKMLHREMTLNEEARTRFEREAVASARIDHPHVTGATDFGKLPDGSCYLVLDYVSGDSLKKVLATEKVLGPDRAVHIVRQIAIALDAAHSAGVVHRDLKPDNVMLIEHKGEPDFVKVLDFGIAKLESRNSGNTVQLTQAGAVFGTPEYMSPEQAAGTLADGRADLYTIGVLLFEMLTGKTPFQGETIVAILTQHLTADPPDLPTTLPQSLRGIVRKLLQKDPELRFQSGEELVAALDQVEAQGNARTIPAPALAADRSRGLLAVAHTGLHVSRTRLWPALRRWGQTPVSFKHRTFALWQPAAAAFVIGVGLAWFVWPSASPEAASQRAATNPASGQHTGKPKPAPSVDIPAARAGRAGALRELEELPRADRTAEQWAALVVGEFRAGNPKSSLAALDAALQKAPAVRDDADVFRAAVALGLLSDTSDIAVGYVEDFGERGADLLYAWSRSPPEAAPKDLKKRASAALDQAKHISAALRVALDLDAARTCSSVKAILPRAKSDADERSGAALQRKTARRGCGLLSLGDCWRCLRGNDDLAEAIDAAKGRPAPELVEPLRAPAASPSAPTR